MGSAAEAQAWHRAGLAESHRHPSPDLTLLLLCLLLSGLPQTPCYSLLSVRTGTETQAKDQVLNPIGLSQLTCPSAWGYSRQVTVGKHVAVRQFLLSTLALTLRGGFSLPQFPHLCNGDIMAAPAWQGC